MGRWRILKDLELRCLQRPLDSRAKPIPGICVGSNEDDSALSWMNRIQGSQLTPKDWLFSFRNGIYQGPSYWSVGHLAAAVAR